MKLIVDINNYTNFEYSPFLKRGNPVEAPENPTYVVGQVVVIPDENTDEKDKLVLAVVLGCIDEEFDGEVRTDMHGMVCMNKIRPANIDDFGKSNIAFRDALGKECRGFKVSRDWETYEYTIEEPKK
jgi:hypothetical protein